MKHGVEKSLDRRDSIVVSRDGLPFFAKLYLGSTDDRSRVFVDKFGESVKIELGLTNQELALFEKGLVVALLRYSQADPSWFAKSPEAQVLKNLPFIGSIARLPERALAWYDLAISRVNEAIRAYADALEIHERRLKQLMRGANLMASSWEKNGVEVNGTIEMGDNTEQAVKETLATLKRTSF